MLLSIVIPVYNVENYLLKCIDSIININERNMEIILIDDGSTDNSGKICDEYSEKYDFIRVYHKKNGGLSHARNYGLDRAVGKYVMFVDSDDFLDSSNMNKLLIGLAKNEDIDVILNPFYEYVNEEVVGISGTNNNIEKDKVFIKEEVLKDIFNYTDGLWTAWKYIVRKEFLNEKNIRFKEGYLHEDVDFTTRIITQMSNFMIKSLPIYYYRLQRAGSIMNNRGFKSLRDTTNIIVDLNEFIERDLKLGKDDCMCIFDTLSKSFYSSIYLYKKGNKVDKNWLINLLKNNKQLFYYSKDKRHQIFYVLIKVFGVRNMLELYCLLK